MIRKNNFYLSEPQHLGASIEVPKMRVDVRDLPRILEEENFRQDQQYWYPKEYGYTIGRPNPKGLWGYDCQAERTINLLEVFAKLEKIEEIEISEEKGNLGGFFHITALLCDIINVAYNARERDLFLWLAYSLKDCEKSKITWQKKDTGEFSLTIFWRTATKKTFRAKTLLECFNQANYFVF